ncbi:hypothetical protein [Streptomyces sp. NPDC058307]
MPQSKTLKFALRGAAAVLIGFSTFAFVANICIPSSVTAAASRA